MSAKRDSAIVLRSDEIRAIQRYVRREHASNRRTPYSTVAGSATDASNGVCAYHERQRCAAVYYSPLRRTQCTVPP